MYRTLTVLALVLLATGGASADTSNITLGPAVLTYPEIVRQLNAQGQHVHYDSHLRDRAAYVYLKQRSWAETRSLLSEGLEIRFRQKQDQPDTWVMEPDPTIQSREDRWFQEYAANIRFLLHRAIQPVLPYMNLSYAALWNEFQTLEKQLHEQLAAAREDGSLEDPEIAQRFLRLEEQNHDMRTATRLDFWFTAHLLKAGLLGDPIDILQGKFTVRMASANSLVDEASLSVMKKAIDNIDSNPLLVYGWDFYGDDIAPSVSFHFITPDGKDESLVFDRNHRPTTGQIFDGLSAPFYPSLSEEAQKWLLARRAETRAFLKTDIAKKPFSLCSAIRDREVRSVSEVIESWSRAQDAEAVMELWPIRENFGSLALPPNPWAFPSGRLMNLAEIFNDPEAQPGTLDDRGGAWTLHDRSGVLLVTNRLAFLDHFRQPSLAPFLKMRKEMLAHQVQLPDYQMLAGFCQQTNPAQYEVWRSIRPYRGIDMEDIYFYPAIYLWNSLPEKDRLQIERTVQTQPYVTFPLGRLTPGTLAQLQTILQRFEFTCPQCWRPDFATYLSQCTLTVSDIKRSPGGGPKPEGVVLSVNGIIEGDLRGVPVLDSQTSVRNLPVPVRVALPLRETAAEKTKLRPLSIRSFAVEKGENQCSEYLRF